MQLTYDEFILTIENDELPPNLPLYLQALWYDAKGDWHKAHSLIDSLDDKNAYLVHAFLHRKEGDLNNANYWYTQAHTRLPQISLQEEWKKLTMDLLLKS